MKQRRLAGLIFARVSLGAAIFCTLHVQHPAFAQQLSCGPESVVVEALRRDYGEGQIASFLDRRGSLMRLLVNPDTRSWTLLALGPAGQACLIGFGDTFEPETPPVRQGRDS